MSEVVRHEGEPDEDLVVRIGKLLDAGELVVVPTDTVYAVLANPFHPDGPERLRVARGTDRTPPFPVAVASTWQVKALGRVTEPVERLMEAFWPGPLTLLLQGNESTAWDLGDTGGVVAVRLPDEPLLLEILRRTGPLAFTAASMAGEDPPASAEAARQALDAAVALYVDAGTRDGPPTTIVDASRGGAEVRRLGAVSADQVFRAAKGLPLEDPEGEGTGDAEPVD
jgi:tRNA threonylcarbamoyl adenosine modification protein (Sua5/YciO/YrdC/YwlC family)